MMLVVIITRPYLIGKMYQKKNPLISIIIPAFNRAHLIEETLDSIIGQTYKFWECIIIDDGSTDDSEKVITEYVKIDSRFQFHHRPNTFKKGPSGCRNYGLKLSKGKYINWFDSDDLMISDKLETQIGYLEANKYDFCISQTLLFDHKTKEIMGNWNDKLFSKDPINDFIMLRIGWSTNAPLWRKKSLIKYNLLFNEKLIGPDDFDFHIQVLKNGLEPKVISKVHVRNRVHPNRIENNKSKAYSKSIIVIDLLKNKEKLNLSKECITMQLKLCYYLLKNMYKQKRIGQGIQFSKNCFCMIIKNLAY